MRNSLADVVDAALRVLDAHGLENCSMRRVASELDVQPSALYHHVPNKQTLLALMADEIVHGVGRTLDNPGMICLELRTAMLAVRDGAEVVATAAAFRLGASAVERRLADLVGADGARTLLLYTFGQAQATQMHRQAAALGALVPGADPAQDPGADPGANPAAEPGTDPAPDQDLDASFARGLGIILAGLGR